ncbi:LamG domain-containing protein [Catenovulum sediminis]|uniref:LamG domain-containing protein n=1 Tax=Catenovulum sediminis TaxID=1740262 RepID=A0ABV1RL68_9ALTE|nr:LamG domain-containing protein [Catenovulum sediminis]
MIFNTLSQTVKHRSLWLIFAALILSGCGGSEVESKPPQQQDNDTGYKGPPPQTQDVQDFKLALWDNISGEDRCGACHTPDIQAPYFANRDDINLAFTATGPLVNLAEPNKSRLVEKVASGHNCWLSSAQACGETMTQWIKIWSDDRVEQSNTLELIAPELKTVGSSKSFPPDNTLFAEHIYPLTRQYCATCHNESATLAQSPFFASPDAQRAYDSAKKVINLDEPALSRLVIRLGQEFHNCWDDCQQNANTMQQAIANFSDALQVEQLSPDTLASKALNLTDGLVAASEGRFESNLIAFYQFKTGSGNVAFDTSGVAPAANLNFSGDVEWLGGWGIQLNGGRAQASTVTSKKLHDLLTLTGEFTIESWLVPGNVVQQGPARIISYSAGDQDRNFTLGQTQYNYDFLLRTQDSDNNGQPALSTPDADEVLQASQQHLVMRFDPVNGRQIYVNGELIDNDQDDERLSPLANWDDSYALMLGNEASGNHPWQGSIRLLAIYNRALSDEQILQNYDAGVGERFLLLFSIADLIDLEATYIVFEVSQFDNYSYLFGVPKIVNLNGASLPQALTIKGLRIGINGKESLVGQTFSHLNVELASGQALDQMYALSPLGSVIAIEKGAMQDEFFLTFEQIGEKQFVRSENSVPIVDEVGGEQKSAQIGLRNFAEINASMSTLTQVPSHQTQVATVYNRVKRQLPSLENIDTFISAQQMAITQLAIAYCDAALDDEDIKNSWLPDVDFSQSPEVAYSDELKDNLITPLLARFLPLEAQIQPDKSTVKTELSDLIDRLSACGRNTSESNNEISQCDAQRTATIAKASCTSVLASAVVLLQ